MADEGLDLRTWLTIVGVFVTFFALPALMLKQERRKKRREGGLNEAAGQRSTLPPERQ